MFLIEFKKDMYIDAERVNFINLTDGKVEFTLTGEAEQWIQHAIEEMLDGAQYLYRIKQELAKRLDK